MGIYQLQISTNMENVKELFLEILPEMRWYIRAQCSSCREDLHSEPTSWLYFTRNKVLNSKGQEVNFVIRCKNCKNEATIDVDLKTLKSYKYNENHGGGDNFEPIIDMECRGLVPTGYDFREGWNVKSLSTGELFSEIEFEKTEGCYDGTQVDWSEFDIKSKLTISCFNTKSRFMRTKK